MVPDIAIIELVEKVNMTTTIQPVCLPKSGEELPEGSKLYATGWGGVEGKNAPSQVLYDKNIYVYLELSI